MNQQQTTFILPEGIKAHSGRGVHAWILLTEPVSHNTRALLTGSSACTVCGAQIQLVAGGLFACPNSRFQDGIYDIEPQIKGSPEQFKLDPSRAC